MFCLGFHDKNNFLNAIHYENSILDVRGRIALKVEIGLSSRRR